MSMQNTKLINQKEYLKKYLSGDKEKKKKKKDKKHKKSGQAKVKIIDDDAYDENREEMDEDLLLGGEDAPQIVGEYIEENANAIRSKWRNIAVKDEPKTETEEISLRIKEEPKEEEEELWGRKSHTAQIKQECEKELSKSSPIAIRIKQEKRSSSRERSPVQSKRKNSSDQNSPRRKQKRDSDHSPVRKRRNSDQSPPRKRQNSDQSPPRRQRSNNISPPRRYRDKDSFHQSPPEKRNRSALKRRDSDQSPARKRPDADQSLSRRGSDQSPPRRRPAASTDQSPPRRKADFPPKITKREERCTSPPQRERKSRWARTEGSRTPSPPPTHKPKAQSARTLDGKKAGLQDAQSLKTESDIRRREEQRMFEQMSSDVSGRNAEVQMRSTGRRGRRAREAAEEDPVEQQRKAAHEEKKKELYNRWGKGLKQLEDQQARHAEMAHEASKPVARYANDEDLDRHLREQEHADDPMLEYMRQKRKKREEQSDKPVMPVYEGSYPENRYGIRPGYRWDGVDRSNGYEQRWFDKQNERRAVQDEAYKYSVEDM